MDITQQLLRVTDDGTFSDGCAEPWVVNILAALLVGNATRVAIEIGGFQGYTSKRLIKALCDLPWENELTVCEIDQVRAEQTCKAIEKLPLITEYRTRFKVVCANSLNWIPTLADASVDFVWLDGNHEMPHVARELALLRNKIAPGGLLCGHDVHGVCQLQHVFRGAGALWGWDHISLDLPRLGPAGGIGIIQRPR